MVLYTEFTINLSCNQKTKTMFKPNDTFLSLSVYKFPLGNCGGITDTIKTVYIPCPTGPTKFSNINPEHVFIPEKRGVNYFALTPLLQPAGMIGPMAGGNLAYSSDSRCETVYHIHDRFETQEQYDRLSR